MSYIARIKDELSGMTYTAIWQHLLVKTYGDILSLVHPCTVTKSLLRKQLPKTINLEEVLAKIPAKQKELARRLNITILPSDREPGFIGQAALFEILRNSRHDLSYYLDNVIEKQLKMWCDGFGLLQTLAGLCQLRRYFECAPIDIVMYILEPLNPNTISVLWSKNWMYRVITNAQAMQPFLPNNSDTYHVLKRLVRIQDARGPSISRIMDWTSKTRSQASRLLDAMSSSGLIHVYAPVLKNTGIVRTLTKNTSPSKTLVEQEVLCASLEDDRDYFLSFSYSSKKSEESKYHDLGAVVCNVEHYDVEDQIWRVPKTATDAKRVEDIYALFHNSDHAIQDNNMSPTDRDLFFIAMLQAMSMEHIPKKHNESIRRIVGGCNIPRDEVELGLRNIIRKNMIRNQYSFIIAHDRQVLYICYDDSTKKTIPMLGKILTSVPIAYVTTKADLSYGTLGVHHPTYLACEVRDIIHSAIKESDVNAEVFAMKSYKRGDTANLLSLIQEN